VRSKLDDTEAAFREVISLDLERILSRLRSRHAKSTRKTAGKRPLIEQLHDAIHSRSIKATKTIKEAGVGYKSLVVSQNIRSVLDGPRCSSLVPSASPLSPKRKLKDPQCPPRHRTSRHQPLVWLIASRYMAPPTSPAVISEEGVVVSWSAEAWAS
jgi:hypothetical protein